VDGGPDHFPSYPDAHDVARLAFGLDLNNSYRAFILELAPRKAAALLALPAVRNVCEVCGEPVDGEQSTCSAACRTRLWRQRHASP